MAIANITNNILTDSGVATSSLLPLTGGTLTGALSGTSATFSLDATINGVKVGKGAGSGTFNTAIGYIALSQNTTGSYNSAFGAYSLSTNSNGIYNAAIGYQALLSNTSGSSNVSVGSLSMHDNTTGQNNTAIGTSSGYYITTGSYNTIVGNYAGTTTLDSNVILADGNGNLRFVGFSTGNVYLGAGTTLPTDSGYKLDVNGTGRFVGILNVFAPSANYATLNLNGAAGYGAELKFGEVTGGYLAAIRHNYNVGTGLEFYTGGLAAGNLRMYISPTGNLGLGVTPSSWSTSNDVRAIQLKAGAFWNYGDFSTYFGLNYYWDGSARRYIISDYASEYQQISGEHRWFSAPSGTAGASATFTERMRITSGGNVLIGTITDATGKLQVNGTVYATGFYESSDIRFKNILETNPNVNVLGIDVIKFTRKDNDTNQVRYGYSAQQVQSILPDAVTGTDFLNVNYLDVHTLKIAQLEKEIKELKAK
jgi:hypothetical protein